MIFVLFTDDSPEARAAESRDRLALMVHGHVPDNHSVDLNTEPRRIRRICGEHGRIVPTRQGLCPTCGGSTIDVAEEDRIRSAAEALGAAGLWDPAHVGYARMRPFYHQQPSL